MLIHVKLLSQNAVLPEPTEHINVFRLKVAVCVESQPMVTLDAGLSFAFPPNAHATVHTTADIWKYGLVPCQGNKVLLRDDRAIVDYYRLGPFTIPYTAGDTFALLVVHANEPVTFTDKEIQQIGDNNGTQS